MTVALFLGVFHFGNPRRDAVHVDQIDILAEPCQAYLAALARQLAMYRPTRLLAEVHPSRIDQTNEQYRAYLAGRLEPDRPEVQQLGFRVAEASGLDRLHGIDEWRPLMLFGELLDYMADKDPGAKAAFDSLLESESAEEAHAHATMDLRTLLLRTNDDDIDRRNKAAYLSTNAVGAGDSFIGADATARHWNRNFRMYANIQRHTAPGARLLVIAGQGHTAVLKDFARDDPNVVVESALPYLRDA